MSALGHCSCEIKAKCGRPEGMLGIGREMQDPFILPWPGFVALLALGSLPP